MSTATESVNGTQFQVVLEALRRGDDAAWRELLGRYSKRLIALARSRLFGNQLRAEVSPESVAQAVVCTFFRRHGKGQFQIKNWDALWGLLMTLTVRRVTRLNRHHSAGMRDIMRKEPLPKPLTGDEDVQRSAQTEPVDPLPRPDEVAELLDTVRHELGEMPEPQRQAIELGLMGFHDDAISKAVGRSEARVSQIREDWAEALQKAVDGLQGRDEA